MSGFASVRGSGRRHWQGRRRGCRERQGQRGRRSGGPGWLLLRGLRRALERRRQPKAACLGAGTTPLIGGRDVAPWRRSERPVRAEPRGQRSELIEDLHQFVVRAGLRQHLGGRYQGLAGPGGGAEARLRVRLEQRGENLPERLRNALRGTRSALLGKAFDERLGVGLGPLQEVQGDEAHGEEVRREVRLGAQHLLGGEVAGRPHDVIGLGQPGLTLAHGYAEVRQAQMRTPGAGGFEQDVGRLDVAVHDPLGVDGREPREELVEQRAGEAERQRAVVADDVRQRTAGDQVHGEQDLVVVGGPTGGGEHMRMVDPQGLLPDEPQQGVRVALPEHLGGHIAVAPVVPGTPDRSDSPVPDRIDQFVPAGEDLTHGRVPLPFRAVRRPGRRISSGAPRSGRPRPRCARRRTPGGTLPAPGGWGRGNRRHR